MTLSFNQNTKSKARMACHQRIRPSNIIKTQKIRYGWRGIKAYDPIVLEKHKN